MSFEFPFFFQFCSQLSTSFLFIRRSLTHNSTLRSPRLLGNHTTYSRLCFWVFNDFHLFGWRVKVAFESGFGSGDLRNSIILPLPNLHFIMQRMSNQASLLSLSTLCSHWYLCVLSLISHIIPEVIVFLWLGLKSFSKSFN